VIAQIAVAGSISRATGGKFANGAAYAAFAIAVEAGANTYRDSSTNKFIENNVEHSTETADGNVATPIPDELRAALVKYGRSPDGSRIISHALETD